MPGVPGHTQFLDQIRVKTYVGTPSFYCEMCPSLCGHTQFLLRNVPEKVGHTQFQKRDYLPVKNLQGTLILILWAPKIRISTGTPNELPNLRDSVIFCGILWESTRFREILQDSMRFRKIPRDSARFCKIPIVSAIVCKIIQTSYKGYEFNASYEIKVLQQRRRRQKRFKEGCATLAQP